MWFQLIAISAIQAIVLTGAAIGYRVGQSKPAVLPVAEFAAISVDPASQGECVGGLGPTT